MAGVAPEQPKFLMINCPCGFVIRGDIEVELISNARNHIDEAHPDRAGITDEELLADAMEQPAAP
jgi:predicted small metal-binding protein